MSSLNAALATALSGLNAAQGALEATTNNVANSNTPGYSREVPELVTNDPVEVGSLTVGTGVTLQSIESIRDPILEAQIQQETETQGQMNALVSALSDVQSNFSTGTADIGTEISNFFDSINQLSTNPSDTSLRDAVLTAANNLASAFNNAANQMTSQQTSLNACVVQNVDQINQLTGQIAQLNGKIASLENTGASAGTFIDQRTQAIDQLSALVDVSVIPSDNTLTLTTAAGTALVSGQQSFALSTESNASGLEEVYSGTSNITSSIVSGQLGGVLAARDQQIPTIENQLDTLAAGIANAVNGVQAQGYDLSGNAGTDLFTAPPANGSGSAASMSVAITDPSLIAASSDGTQGSNGNANAMYALSNQAIVDGQSPTDYYAGMVSNVGNAVSNATAEQTASNQVLQQLNDQRASVSGVSLDEEAANMIQYQQAYAASAQVISAINSMMYDVINMTTLTT
ncbi:MAG TPA: flagellar hook-associated protein FlgK [Verrucomicrobiae bacterium]|nr:flagellar hook-associated protein FlgK [Verrucomicrobiae bacterium]